MTDGGGPLAMKGFSMSAAAARVTVGLLLMLVLLTGCNRKPATQVVPGPPPPKAGRNEEAARYYDALAKVVRKVDDAHLALFQGMASGKLMNPGDLQKAQDQFVQSMAAAKAEVKAQKMPSLPGAQQLQEATQRFLDAEEG